jgi:hypothetical protein
MRMHRGTGRTTDGFLAAFLPLFVLAAGACVSGRGGPAPDAPPVPRSSPGAEDQPTSRFPRSIDAIRQVTLRKGRLGWGGLEVGMTFHQTELVLGRRLPALEDTEPDELCGYRALEAELMRQPLRLEFSDEEDEDHLQAIWLPLQSRSGPPGRDEIVEAVRARFPRLEHVPSPHAPDLPEDENPQPLYRLPDGEEMVFVQEGAIYFGEICVD